MRGVAFMGVMKKKNDEKMAVLEFLRKVFCAELEALDGGIVHPVAVAFQNDGIHLHGKGLCHQAVQVHIAGAQLHAVGFQDGRDGAAGDDAGAPVVDVPQLHAGAEPLHPCQRVRTALGEPVAVKLKVDKFGIRFHRLKYRRCAFLRSHAAARSCDCGRAGGCPRLPRLCRLCSAAVQAGV